MEQTKIFDAYDHFEGIDDFKQFISQKGEIRRKNESAWMPWEFDLWIHWFKMPADGRLLFYFSHVYAEDLIVCEFYPEDQSIATIFTADVNLISDDYFYRQDVHICNDGTLFLTGKARTEIHDSYRYYVLHFAADGTLLGKFGQTDRNFTAIPYAFSPQLQTVFVWNNQPWKCCATISKTTRSNRCCVHKICRRTYGKQSIPGRGCL